jgi:hypothetical protein
MKKVLIAGCSHAAGSEIDGTEDSMYNRRKSFGGIFSSAIGAEDTNISLVGATNPMIARSILEWFKNNYNDREEDLLVLIAWTETSRLEVPLVERMHDYKSSNVAVDWFSTSSDYFLQINQGWKGQTPEEKRMLPFYQKFIADNLLYLEIVTLNLILQIQFFLQSKKVDYIMCNTMDSFSSNPCLTIYKELVNKEKYFNFDRRDEGFFWKYRNLGYTNAKAKYWHHGEDPHRLYAESLLEFYRGYLKC